MRKDLSKLQKRARRVLKEEANQNILKSRRKRLSPLRICIWLAEALVLLIVIEHFFIRPRTGDSETNGYPPLKKDTWQRAELLGQEAREMRALSEPEIIYLPPVDGLADGSLSAREAQRVVSSEKKLPIETVNSLGMKFRLIPNGSFMMGSPPREKGRWEGEVPHLIHIRQPFYLSKTEVTQRQWKAVMGPTSNPSKFTGDDRPVEEVSWYDCQEFLIALAAQENVPKWTYRLPTEEQWEYVARAGTDTAYYFGDNPARLDNYEWYRANSYGSTHKVARFRPNAYGLYDILGNVWEWCWNSYKPYPGSPEKLSDEYNWEIIRVIRGGNWKVNAQLCRVANRARLGPTSKGNMLGFRVVRHIYELKSPGEPDSAP